MYIITAIPIVSIPRPRRAGPPADRQVFSYFFHTSLKRGSLADVPFANRIVKALVLKSQKLQEKKIDIKKASFKLKGVKKQTSPEAVMSETEIRFALWLADYFFALNRTSFRWPLFEKDFLPYCTDPENWWVGCYTSRCV